MAKRPVRTPSAADKRAKAETQSALLKIAAVAVIVVAVAATYFKVSASLRALDPQTLCPSDPASVTVLLVDVTDPMNVAQRQDFINQLAGLKNSIPRYGKLIVTQVNQASQNLLSPVIERCNPGTAADVSPMTGDPAAVQRQRAEGFDKPLDEAFLRIATSTGADQSPILQSMQSVALTALQSPAVVAKPRRLIVVSDLLQNTAGLSFYGALPEPDRLISSAEFRHTRTDLRGVKVELWMLERPDAASTQPRALAELWERIISELRGDLTRIYNVSG